MSNPLIDIEGQRFGRWLVLRRTDPGEWPGVRWICQCDCGSVRVIRGSDLRRTDGRQSRSCGCLHRDNMTKHGKCTTRMYGAWQTMIARCENPKNESWTTYGARGIRVCDEWHDFEKFLADVGEAPPGMTLDRIDNDRGYEPGNVRWATPREQARNRRDNHLLTHGDVTLTLTEWAERMDMHPGALRGRLDLGWSVKDALTVPVRPRHRPS